MGRSVFILAVILMSISIAGALAVDTENSSNERLVSIVTPANGAVISGSEVEISVSFNSNQARPVSKVQVYLDGKSVTERDYDPPVASGVSPFRWDTWRTPNGKHKLDIQVYSGDEYLGMASCTVSVMNISPDLTIPRAAITSPAEGQVVSGVTPIIVDASDDSGADPFVSIFVDGSLRSVANHGPYTYAWDTTIYDNGSHTISVTAMDISDNKAEARPVRVIVRNSVNRIPLMAEPDEVLPGDDDSSSTTFVLPSLAELSESPWTSDIPETLDRESRRTVSDANNIAPETFEVSPPSAKAVVPPASPETVPEIPVLASEPVEPVPMRHELSKPESSAQVSADAERPAAIGNPAEDAGSRADRVSETPRQVAASKPVRKERRAEFARLPIPTPMPELKVPVSAAVPRKVVETIKRATDTGLRASKAASEYVVRSGDCIARLAAKFDVPAQSIIEMNNIQNPSLIRVGEKLLIPTANTRMVAIRPVFEKVGGVLVWDGVSHTVRAISSEHDVELKIGSARATVDAETVMMDRPATIGSGRALVSESFVTQTLRMERP